MLYYGISNEPWNRHVVTEPFVTVDDVFTADECVRAVATCEDGVFGWERATTFGGDDNSTRRCDIKFIRPHAATAWIFDKLNRLVGSINASFYGFDLNGYDSFQYTSYQGSERGTYGWHMDSFMGRRGLPADMIQPRKLSLTLLLNEGYEGGEFQFNIGNQDAPEMVPVKMGRIIAFPSYMIHSVKPVTSGCRRSIVVWVTGPKWR